MLRSVAIALLLCLPAFAGVDEDLERTLRSLDRGEPLGHVTGALAREAARQIAPEVPERRVLQLIAVARKGKLELLLDRALQRLIEQRGVGARAAARALAELPEERLHELLDPPPPKWAEDLRPLLEPRDRNNDIAVLKLLVPAASAELLTAIYRDWRDSPERIDLLLRVLGTCPKPAKRKLLALLDRYPPPASTRDAVIIACQDLADDLQAGAQLVKWVETGRLGPSSGFLHAVSFVPPGLWEQAAQALLPYLDDETADRQAAAILGCARLLRHELLDRIPGFVTTSNHRLVRVAAITALVPLGYRDEPTLKLLVGLLDDKDVAVRAAAHATLIKKSGVTLPLHTPTWHAWVTGKNLPDEPPTPTEERLAKQRKLAADQAAAADDDDDHGHATSGRRGTRLPRVVVIAQGPSSLKSVSDLANIDHTRKADREAIKKTAPPPAPPAAERTTFHPAVAVGIGVALIALLGWAWSLQRSPPVPIKLALPERKLVEEKRELLAKLPDPPTRQKGQQIAKQLYENPELGNTTRISRLQDVLDLKQAGMLDTVNGDDTHVIASFRAALKSVQRAHHHAPSLQTANDALAEIHKLGTGIGDHPMDTATFEALQRKVESLQTRADGAGLTEMARESCFLLLQVAHCLRAGAELPPKTAERWSRMLDDLGEKVATTTIGEREPPNAPQDAMTVDTSVAFGEKPLDARTVDVDKVFPGAPKDAGTMDVDQVFDPVPKDAGTMDVDKVFAGAPPPPPLAPAPAAAVLGPVDPLVQARRDVLDHVSDPGTRAVVTYAFQQSYLQPLHVEGALAAAGSGPLLPHLRPLLTPQQISELTVIYRRAAEGYDVPSPSDTATETAGFDSVFPEDDESA